MNASYLYLTNDYFCFLKFCMLQYLKPKSGSHAISKAKATIFTPQAFVKPKDLLLKYINDEGFKSYEKKTLLRTTTFNVENNQINRLPEKVQGLLFESFQSNGTIDNIFKLQNDSDTRASISVETRNYDRWHGFLSQLKKGFELFANKTEFYVEAINLNYQDEFDWINDKKQIPCDLIFNSESELLNETFLKGNNGTLISLVQGNSDLNNLFYEEKTEITFNNDTNRVIVNHNYAFRLNEVKTFDSVKEELYPLFENAHESNKKVLKELFTDDVLELINLK